MIFNLQPTSPILQVILLTPLVSVVTDYVETQGHPQKPPGSWNLPLIRVEFYWTNEIDRRRPARSGTSAGLEWPFENAPSNPVLRWCPEHTFISLRYSFTVVAIQDNGIAFCQSPSLLGRHQ